MILCLKSAHQNNTRGLSLANPEVAYYFIMSIVLQVLYSVVQNGLAKCLVVGAFTRECRSDLETLLWRYDAYVKLCRLLNKR